ncbi:unnamed protein product [Amaranthus hypochondriacus]
MKSKHNQIFFFPLFLAANFGVGEGVFSRSNIPKSKLGKSMSAVRFLTTLILSIISLISSITFGSEYHCDSVGEFDDYPTS